MISKLNVYRGDKHPHQAQKPVDLALKQAELRLGVSVRSL